MSSLATSRTGRPNWYFLHCWYAGIVVIFWLEIEITAELVIHNARERIGG